MIKLNCTHLVGKNKDLALLLFSPMSKLLPLFLCLKKNEKVVTDHLL